jgi:flagellar biogenesis protein FliO
MTPGAPWPALALLENPTGLGYEGPDLTWYLVTCVLVIGGLCGLGVLLRKVLARAMQGRAAKRSLQVMDVLPLGGKQRLAVVRCYDRSFLLGLGDKEVRKIAELDADEVLAPEAPEEEPVETPHPVRDLAQFEELMRQSTDRLTPPAPRRESEGAAPPRRPVLENGRGILG